MKTIKDFFLALKEITFEYLKSRIFPVTVIMIVLFAVLVHRLFDLQIRHGSEYQEEMTVSSTKTTRVDSIRGNIYDVNGKLLASNEISYTLTFGNDSRQSELADSLGISENQMKNRILSRTIRILQMNQDDTDASFQITMDQKGTYSYQVNGAARNSFLRDVYAVTRGNELTDEQKNASAEEVVSYLKDLFEIGPEYTDEMGMKILACRYNLWLNRFQQYVPVEIAHNLSEESRSAIDENKDELPGTSLTVSSSRVYQDAKYFSNIIGYVGKASEEDLDELNQGETADSEEAYTSDDVVGKTGIERSFEKDLHGTDGEQTVEVDSLGKILSVKKETPAVAGHDVYLSIDSDLQKYCYDALEKELASVLIQNIRDIAVINEDEDSQHLIPISDVYTALFSNHTLKMELMQKDDATDLEKRIASEFDSQLDSTLDTLDAELSTSSTALHDLPDTYQDYAEYICEMLSRNQIYHTDQVDQTSQEFLSYTSGNMSLQDFLKYLIQTGAIDASSIEEKDTYYDNDEVYSLLSQYITEELRDDEEFRTRVLSNMVSSGMITGSECIELLYDQGVLKRDGDEEYQQLQAGAMTPYSFMIAKITKLEITPAMLNLTPCSGAVVVTDVKTGAVRALVSYPGYDNNQLTNSVNADYYADLLQDHTNPMFDRTCMMTTAPGSTFKIVSTVAGVSEGVLGLDEVINDEGEFDKVYTKPQCWIYRESHGKLTHGAVDISRALDVSCNYFYYEVGYRLATESGTYNDDAGLRKLKNYASQFGLTEKSGVELSEASPHFSTNDAVTSAIGQGTHAFTPVQLSRYITAVANSGTLFQLSLMDRVTDYEGNVLKQAEHPITSQLDLDSGLWNKIHTGLREVVTDDLGTHKLINGLNVQVAGKTGTAQVGEDQPANALFLSYAPYENPEVSVTTIIPNGYSSGNAADLSAFIYAYLYDKEALNDAEYNTDSNTANVGD